MTFSQQGGQIKNALVSAGLPDGPATQVANILSNCAQALSHAGPITHDRTPQSMRLVDPDARKFALPNFDFPEGSPDHRPTLTPPSEAKPQPQPEPTVIENFSAQQRVDPSVFRLTNGNYTTAVGGGQVARVDLRAQVVGRSPDGRSPLALFAQNKSMLGKGLRANVNVVDNTRVRFFIEETNTEVILNLQLLGVDTYDVVTDVQYLPGQGIQVTKKKVLAWDAGESPRETIIPTVQQDVLRSLSLDEERGVVAQRDQVEVLYVLPVTDAVIPTESCEEDSSGG
jgi:hypothetical protein